MKAEPQVDISVVIPAFNASSSLAMSIDSARKCGVSRVIVVDDGSSDGTANLAAELGCDVISQENSGAANSRMVGLALVETEYVVFLDSDDQLLLEGIRYSLQMMRSCNGAAAAIGATVIASSEGGQIRPWPEGVSTDSLLRRGIAPGPPAALIWRTAKLRSAIGSSPAALCPRYAEDYELVIRGSLVGQILSHTRPTCVYMPLGGKSARNPLRSLSSAEQIRRYYADYLNLTIPRRATFQLKALAHLRSAYSCEGRFGRFWFYGRALTVDPLLPVRLMRERSLRRRLSASSSGYTNVR